MMMMMMMIMTWEAGRKGVREEGRKGGRGKTKYYYYP